MRIALLIATFVAAMVFVIVGLMKFHSDWIERFEGWGYRPGFAMMIGSLEIIGAIALVIPATSFWAALGLTLIMFGALWIHVGAGDGLLMLAPITMIGLLGFVLFGRVVYALDRIR